MDKVLPGSSDTPVTKVNIGSTPIGDKVFQFHIVIFKKVTFTEKCFLNRPKPFFGRTVPYQKPRLCNYMLTHPDSSHNTNWVVAYKIGKGI